MTCITLWDDAHLHRESTTVCVCVCVVRLWSSPTVSKVLLWIAFAGSEIKDHTSTHLCLLSPMESSDDSLTCITLWDDAHLHRESTTVCVCVCVWSDYGPAPPSARCYFESFSQVQRSKITHLLTSASSPLWSPLTTPLTYLGEAVGCDEECSPNQRTPRKLSYLGIHCSFGLARAWSN